MNKFKYLQTVGTITVLSPVILVTLATLIYAANVFTSVEVEEVVVEEKQDTVKPVVLINQPAPVKPAPVVAKPAPVVVATPVIKDTVKPVINTLDTTK
jgi:ribulose 1,5-bisphosphate synthetase/thiazole synthase